MRPWCTNGTFPTERQQDYECDERSKLTIKLHDQQHSVFATSANFSDGQDPGAQMAVFFYRNAQRQRIR